MILIVFSIFEDTDSENVVRKMSKNSRFRVCFEKQYGKRAETLFKSASQHLDHINWSLERKLCSKNSLLLTCQILGLLVNTLPTNEKYPLLNRDTLTIPIQTKLSEKQKSFSEIFAAFLKSIRKFQRFEKKYDTHSFCISEITNSENLVRSMSKKSRFKGPFEKQQGKRAQALLKSA